MKPNPSRKQPMMVNAGKKHMGRAVQAKGTGTGAMTDIDKDKIGDNMVLSNRDKAQHSDQRGQDGAQIKTEQYQDHAGNRLSDSASRSN